MHKVRLPVNSLKADRNCRNSPKILPTERRFELPRHDCAAAQSSFQGTAVLDTFGCWQLGWDFYA